MTKKRKKLQPDNPGQPTADQAGTVAGAKVEARATHKRKAGQSQLKGNHSQGMRLLLGLLGQLAGTALGLAALYGIALFLVRLWQPDPWLPPVHPAQDYTPIWMQETMHPDLVAETQTDITRFGSRFLGQPGEQLTEDYVRSVFEEYGLERYEQPITTAAPRTIRNDLSLIDVEPGNAPRYRRLPDLPLYPFMPNHLAPVATPEEGLQGRLLVLDTDTIASQARFDDVIGIINCASGAYDKDYGFAWSRYAKLGVKALILTHPDGLEAMPWELIANRQNGIVSSISVNFVRLAAGPEILQHSGNRARINVNVVWENVRHTTLLGVMRASAAPAADGKGQENAGTGSNTNREAIIIAASRDATAILPDVAPGVLPALNPAVQLQLLKGLDSYRDSIRRDIIFLSTSGSVMAEDGLNQLLRVLNLNEANRAANPLARALGLAPDNGSDTVGGAESRRVRGVASDMERNEERFQLVRKVSALLQQPGFLTEVASTRITMRQLDGETRDFLMAQWRYILTRIAFQLNENRLRAVIELEKTPDAPVDSSVFQATLQAKRQYDRATAVIGYTPGNLLERKPEYVSRHNPRQLFVDRIKELHAFHTQTQARLEKEMEIAHLFDGYREIAVIQPRLAPAFPGADSQETLAIMSQRLPASIELTNLLGLNAQKLGLANDITIAPMDFDQENLVRAHVEPAIHQPEKVVWKRFGYAHYPFYNTGRLQTFQRYSNPEDAPFMRDTASIEHSLSVLGETVLALAHGNVRLAPVPDQSWTNKTFSGKVLASGVGQSIVPNYPLQGAIVGGPSKLLGREHSIPGYWTHLFVMTDPYGEFYVRNCASDFPGWWAVAEAGGTFSLLAMAFDELGQVTYVKDEGQDGQRLYKSVNLPVHSSATKDVSIVTFRASPVSLTHLNNPQTMRDYTGMQLLRASGLVPFRKQLALQDTDVRTVYLEPNQRCHVTLQSGTPENELVKVIRSFMLNIPGEQGMPLTSGDIPSGRSATRTMPGIGYLAAETPVLPSVPLEVTESMNTVNGLRLALQNRYEMADTLTNQRQLKAESLLGAARERGQPYVSSERKAREAAVYAILNHPVLRDSIYEAVLGILWYLALLAPFVFFMEKLLFCSPDVRRQLAAQIIIFLAVFLLLRWLHPAFQMVRSSLMILLGFFIILISGAITLLFSGKFRENLEELREKQGKVSAAEVNTLGVLASAFMLGLNNMHRRKVRTGLTCITLTLLTFALIAFTSIGTSMVEETQATGPAPYQGLLVKPDNFERISQSELFAHSKKFSAEYAVCPRSMVLGSEYWRDKKRYNPQFKATFKQDGRQVEAAFESILQFAWNEPLRDQIRFTTEGTKWFTSADQGDPGQPLPVFLPDTLASRLGITPAMIEAAPEAGLPFWISGKECLVRGIFTADSLNALRDLDGQDLLPFDIEQMSAITELQGLGYVIAEPDDPRIPADRIVIAPYRDLGMQIEKGDTRLVSIAIAMEDASYRDAREAINLQLEQTGRPHYYGLDRTAYRGLRVREVSMGGLVELLIPLVIAALTVLNTMKGSVYERRNEIYVYNSVGIAPRYIFFMFMAEALVYAVVGSLLGYLLSQGTGRLLIALDMTGGLNMTYASLSTIYASWTITAAVFLSTWYPARSAMEISAPSEDAGWALPEAGMEGIDSAETDPDTLAFDLPFTFRPRGRIAVLAFFHRYLLDNGEGSAGRYYAGPPHIGVREINPQRLLQKTLDDSFQLEMETLSAEDEPAPAEAPSTVMHPGSISHAAFPLTADTADIAPGRLMATYGPGAQAGSGMSSIQHGFAPYINCSIWLKPFDLAVSQQMTILLPPDPETGQFKAHIVLRRISGTREAWMRLNHGFVSLIRRHFLHWRAVSPEQRETMFAEACDLMRATALTDSRAEAQEPRPPTHPPTAERTTNKEQTSSIS